MSVSAIQVLVDFINVEQRRVFHAEGKKKSLYAVLKLLLPLVSEILNTVHQKPSQTLRSFPIH